MKKIVMLNLWIVFRFMSLKSLRVFNFISITPGCISKSISGNKGWGIDKIFIPDGKTETLACYSDEEKEGIWNQTHWFQLGEYLQKLKKT